TTAIYTLSYTTLFRSLQTENGTVETTIPQTTYNALPVAMNNAQKSPIGFLTLVPGMGRDPLFGTPVVNGGFQESSQIYVNGLPRSEEHTSELQSPYDL